MSHESASDGRQTTTTEVSRSYPVAFVDVWTATLAAIETLRGWQTLDRDSHEGTIRINTASPVGHWLLEAGVRLRLDELGQTLLEIRFDEPRHILMPPIAPRRAARLLRRVDRALQRRRAR
jgi:hypothetical protein